MALVGVAVKTLVLLSCFVGVAAYAYGFAMDRYASCIELNNRGLSGVTARVIFSVVGCLMLGIWIYLLIVDESLFRATEFSPCVIGASIDFYANAAVLSVWVAYKESSWISAFFWILLLVCFGSVGYMCIHSAAVALPLTSTAYFPNNFHQQKQQKQASIK